MGAPRVETHPGTGIRTIHRVACRSSARRCECPKTWWLPKIGDERRRSKPFYGTLTDALRTKRRQEADADHQRRLPPGTPSAAITCRDWSARVLRERSRTVKPMTMNSYDRAYRVFIDPTFGSVPIVEVTPVEVGDWLARLLEEHENTDKVYKAFQVIRLIFNEALRHQVIPFNPVLAIRYPRKAMKPARRSRDRVLTLEQYGALLAECRTPRQRLLMRLAVEAGLRSGELCGLRFGDLVDGERPYLRVERNVTEGVYQ